MTKEPSAPRGINLILNVAVATKVTGLHRIVLAVDGIEVAWSHFTLLLQRSEKN